MDDCPYKDVYTGKDEGSVKETPRRLRHCSLWHCSRVAACGTGFQPVGPQARCLCHTFVCLFALVAGGWVGSAAWGQAGPGQDRAITGPAPSEPLRAELVADTPLFRTDGPLRLRLTLVNTSDEAVDISLEQPWREEDGIGLPLELTFGTAEQPALSVAFEDESPKPVQPPPAPLADGFRRLRIGPHACVGTILDLRAHHQAARYPGAYRVEWRPLNGRLSPVTAEFRVEPRKDAIIVTDLGKATFVLAYDDAPRNVDNFLSLVKQGFYDGKTFHRVIPEFVIQGGCPKGDGSGLRPDGKLVPAEFHNTFVEAGTLLMAHKPSDQNSASCQFFIALRRLEELDGQYTVIGQAADEESQRTLQQLAAVATDRRDRPVSPLTIRSINLVDVEVERARNLDVRTGRNPDNETPKKTKPTTQP